MRDIIMILLVFMVGMVKGQVNLPGIPYQAVVRNLDGTPMTNASVEMRFSIRNGDALNGAVVYQENHVVTTNTMGLMSAVIGEGNVLSGEFAQIDWSIMPKFLQVEFKGPNNADFIEMGNQQLMSVPYALHSKDVKVKVSGTGDTLTIGNNSVIVPGLSLANQVPVVFGCVNPNGCNYNPLANTDDGSCILPGTSCDDFNWFTQNDQINNFCECSGTFNSNGVFSLGGGLTDIEGNQYLSIVINGQEWMAENLAVSTYKNGAPISTVWDINIIGPAGAYAAYGDDLSYKSTYGLLYNNYAVKSGNLCPVGWHVPSISEWSTLVTFLGGGGIAGGKMKSTLGWTGVNNGATNLSGFTGLPGGYKQWQGGFASMGVEALWWSSTPYDNLGSQNVILNTNQTTVNGVNGLSNWSGLSVRCLKD